MKLVVLGLLVGVVVCMLILGVNTFFTKVVPQHTHKESTTAVHVPQNDNKQ